MCDVMRQDVDNAGYDLAMECGNIIRHVQVKTSIENTTTAVQKAHRRLEKKPSACIVWIFYDEKTLSIRHYLLFANKFDPLNFERHKTAKHSKGNSLGEKKERPNIVTVNKGDFFKFTTIEGLVRELFG